MIECQCIFSEQLRQIARSFPVPDSRESAQTICNSLMARMSVIDRFFPRSHGREDNLTPLLWLPNWVYQNPPFEPSQWHESIVGALLERANDLDCFVSWGAYRGALLSDLVSEANPIPWFEWLPENTTLTADDGQGVALYHRANCGYVIVNGIVFCAYGYHMFNLYNRFASLPYDWH